MNSEKTDTRTKILRAAEALTRETGAGHLSLEAVAARAGVSKGGLLYHFRSKSELLEAMVADYMARMAETLDDPALKTDTNGVITAYIGIVEQECLNSPAPSSGLLAALAQDPGMLDPVRQRERAFLASIRANAADPTMATLAFLALQGLRGMRLLNTNVIDDATRTEVMDWLRRNLAPERR